MKNPTISEHYYLDALGRVRHLSTNEAALTGARRGSVVARRQASMLVRTLREALHRCGKSARCNVSRDRGHLVHTGSLTRLRHVRSVPMASSELVRSDVKR